MRQEKLKLTEHVKGFKKAIGSYIGDDGKPRPKVFWFGQNRGLAEELCKVVLLEFEQYKRQTGSTVWTPEALERIRHGLDKFRVHFSNCFKLAQYTIAKFGTDPAPKPPTQRRPRSSLRMAFSSLPFARLLLPFAPGT